MTFKNIINKYRKIEASLEVKYDPVNENEITSLIDNLKEENDEVFTFLKNIEKGIEEWSDYFPFIKLDSKIIYTLEKGELNINFSINAGDINLDKYKSAIKEFLSENNNLWNFLFSKVTGEKSVFDYFKDQGDDEDAKDNQVLEYLTLNTNYLVLYLFSKLNEILKSFDVAKKVDISSLVKDGKINIPLKESLNLIINIGSGIDKKSYLVDNKSIIKNEVEKNEDEDEDIQKDEDIDKIMKYIKSTKETSLKNIDIKGSIEGIEIQSEGSEEPEVNEELEEGSEDLSSEEKIVYKEVKDNIIEELGIESNKVVAATMEIDLSNSTVDSDTLEKLADDEIKKVEKGKKLEDSSKEKIKEKLLENDEFKKEISDKMLENKYKYDPKPLSLPINIENVFKLNSDIYNDIYDKSLDSDEEEYLKSLLFKLSYYKILKENGKVFKDFILNNANNYYDKNMDNYKEELKNLLSKIIVKQESNLNSIWKPLKRSIKKLFAYIGKNYDLFVWLNSKYPEELEYFKADHKVYYNKAMNFVDKLMSEFFKGYLNTYEVLVKKDKKTISNNSKLKFLYNYYEKHINKTNLEI